MATEIPLKHPETGIVKNGLYGFSWTTLFFGGIPAIIRGDITPGVLVIIGSFFTCGLVGLIWAFIYNKRYTLGLIEKGYQLCGTEEQNRQARIVLGIEEF